MKLALCLLTILGSGYGMNVPPTTILPKQPREQSTFLPKDPRGEDNEAINLEDVIEFKEPTAMEMSLPHRRNSPLMCGDTVDLETSDLAVLQTRGFPFSYYPRNQNCEWTLEAPAGSTVELWFSFFDVKYGDWFIIGNQAYWGTIWQSFAVPLKVGQDETSITIRFTSNGDHRRGWGFRFVLYESF